MSLSFLFKLQHWQKYDYTDFISTLLHNLETLNLIIIHKIPPRIPNSLVLGGIGVASF